MVKICHTADYNNIAEGRLSVVGHIDYLNMSKINMCEPLTTIFDGIYIEFELSQTEEDHVLFFGFSAENLWNLF